MNPHVLSVRINEARAPGDSTDRKHLAYLLDRQTVAVLDLLSGVQVCVSLHAFIPFQPLINKFQFSEMSVIETNKFFLS